MSKENRSNQHGAQGWSKYQSHGITKGHKSHWCYSTYDNQTIQKSLNHRVDITEGASVKDWEFQLLAQGSMGKNSIINY